MKFGFIIAVILIMTSLIAIFAMCIAFGYSEELKIKEKEIEALRKENNVQKEKISSLQMASYKNVTRQEIREVMLDKKV